MSGVGSIAVEPLAPLVAHLASRLGLRHFVETGTHRGNGAAFAATIFPKVTTIEINQQFHRSAVQRFAGFPVECLLGDSAIVLPDIVTGLSGPAFFWLDGHAGGGFYADEDNCPLLAELEAIARSPFCHVIFIDDARAFLAPPPPPFKAECWPTLTEVLDAARRRFPYYCVVICGAIICVPPEVRPDLVSFCINVRPTI